MAFDSSRSIVAQWNELALQAIRLGDPVPTEMTRALHIAHSAMYDAWAAYDDDAAGAYFKEIATGEDSPAARMEAVSYAAYHALSEVFPDQVYLFKEFFQAQGLDPDKIPTDLSTPSGVGIAAAETVVLARAYDGSNAADEYQDTSGYEPGNTDEPDDPDFDPNLWTPLRVPTGAVRDEHGIPITTGNPASYKVQQPISPHWASVDPFAIDDSDAYLPLTPPKLGDFSEYVDATGKVTTGDAAYREQFSALVDISANLTTEQKVIAEYWADGPQTSTPPGHWNEIAQDVSVREGYGLDEDVKLFFALNNALFDAGIVIWDAKYTYDYVRPQTAIRYLFEDETMSSWAGPNQGTQDIAGGDWVPYQNVTFVTPAFPEFTSGHSGFSYAGAAIIEAFTGTDSYYDGTSRGAYDLDGDGEFDLIGEYVTDKLAFEDYSGEAITLQWPSLWDAAAEAGLSRLYGGIHIQDGDLFGRQIGYEVAEDVWTATAMLFDMDGDNSFDASALPEGRLSLGAGSDEIIGGLSELNDLRILGFSSDDRILVQNVRLPDNGFGVSSGSAILELDQDGDGVPDAIITLEGDYENDRFIAVEVNGETTLRIATDADVELADTSERFITTDTSANVVAAGDGDDVLVSAGGGDILDGDAGNDVLLGGDEDDILIGGGGGDITTGGVGADIFSFDADDAPATSGFTAEFITDFESGTDTVELSGFAGLSFDTLTWTPTEAGIALVLPNNRFIVFEGIESQFGLTEQDFVFPASGRDVIFSESKPQILTDAGDRYVSSGLVFDDVEGRGGDDAIITGDGVDRLRGGDGDDVLNAGTGEDILEGGAGSDNLTGGSDSDLFRFFGSDDPAGAGFVADFITDFEIGIDKLEIFGFSGISQFSEISFLALEAGLGANLGGGRFIVFEGFTDAGQLDENDFFFIGDPPIIDAALAEDTGSSDQDGVTSNPTIAGTLEDDIGIAKFEIAIAGSDTFADVTSYAQPDGRFTLDQAALELVLGGPLASGAQSFTLRATDLEGQTAEQTILFTLDQSAPTVIAAPSGSLETSPDTLTIRFSEAMSATAFAVGGFALTDDNGETIRITSVDRISSDTARLNLADTLNDGAYTLLVPTAADVAGNSLGGTSSFDFTVDALTRIVSTGPTDGAQRATLDRQIVVEFDRAVQRDTVDAESFQVIALGQALEGRITVSSNGKVLTFFPDELLPAATQLRIKVDGDQILGADGKALDADGDGEAGGVLESDFSTVTLTRIQGTNVEGFIFDANYRDEDGLDIPLEGVVVKVVGLPGVEAVTDASGRFFLENLPIPQVYLDFDASNVVNRDDFDYGTIVKPVDTVAGQTVGLTSGDKAFNIYFAALAEGDVTLINAGEATKAGIGANGLANLTEIFPNIDPAEWSKLKVTIPADSLTFNDGTQATEVSVMVFEPDRIPAPLPAGFDPTVVFTVKAGDATNVDGKAQIDFPNIDNLEIGEKRPILSFDHDAGAWVQSGTAIVVDDGNGGTVLRSEGDTGVNTLGWKGIGGPPTAPIDPPPPEEPEEPKSWDEIKQCLQDNYENNQGTAGGGYAFQVACIAEAACDNSDDWAQGWVKDVFERIGADVEAGRNQYADEHFTQNFPNQITPGVTINGTTYFIGLGSIGAAIDGVQHFLNELEPGFRENADRLNDDANGNGRIDHEEFFEQAVEPCFDAAVSAGEISIAGGWIAQQLVPRLARAQRESIVAELQQNNRLQQIQQVALQTNNAPELNPLYIDELGDDGSLIFEFDNTIVETDGFIQLAIHRDGESLGIADGVEFQVLSGSKRYEVSGENLTIKDFASPIAGRLEALIVAAFYEGEYGLAQIAIRGSDADDDGLVDLAERNLGIADNGQAKETDSDKDGLSDYDEALLQTDPLVADTDGDGLFDGIELDIGTSARNAEDFASVSGLGAAVWAIFDEQGLVVSRANATEWPSEISTLLSTSFDGELRVYFPDTELGAVLPILGGIAATRLVPVSFQVDTDRDGLVDFAEPIYGTSIDNFDTDGDGIKDGAEIEQGLNPLDGVGFPTGVIGNTAVNGNARDVNLAGALDGAGGQTAFVATGDHGLAIIDASQFSNPILLSELDLSGDNSRVVVDAARDLAFVASTTGLHIVDISDPVAPQLVQTTAIPGGAQSLMFRDGLLFVGGRDLYVVNPAAGAILAEIDTTGPVKDIAASGDTIYAVVDNKTLVSYAFNGQFLVELDSVTIPTPPRRVQPFDDFRIFVSDDVAYVSNGFDLTVIAPSRPLERGGYVTFDVSDPANLALISNIDTPAVQAANNQTVTNGAGLGLVAAGQRGLQIHDTSDPGLTYDLIAEFNTPGDAQALALASGIAYVADGSGGLQVINFLPFDANGQPPTVTFNSSASDADPDTAGIQVEEGETIRLDLGITDDVQIRNVELLVNGQVVLNDVSAPYDLAFSVPSLADGATSVEIAVRATDTGGNATTSETVIFDIIPDITPPEVLTISPPDGRLILVGESTVSIAFSEPVDSDAISADGVIVVASDGTETAAKDLVLLADDQVALFTFDPLALGDYTLNFNLVGVTDRAGNPVVTPPTSQSITVVDATAVWNDPAGGSWFDASKWRDGVVPDAQDGVAVVVDDEAVVTAAGNIDVERILLQGNLQFSSGTFTSDVFEGVAGQLRQSSGTIANTTLSGEDGFTVEVLSGVWSGVTLDAVAGIGDQFTRSLDVEGGLTVDGDLRVGNASSGSSRVDFRSTQVVDGTGTITLETANAYLQVENEDSSLAERVTLGADLTLRGTGYTQGNTLDRFTILGDVFGDDGELRLAYIDNAGAALKLDSSSDGYVELSTAIDNAAVQVAAGADVRAVSSQFNTVSLGGTGTTRIESATVSDLTVLGQAEIEGVSANRTATVTVTNDLTVEGELALSGTNSRFANLNFTGGQAVDGAGEIFLSRNNAIGDETIFNQVTLNNALSGEREVLTFGEDIAIKGTGGVTVSRSEDRIQVLGTAAGVGGQLLLSYVDNEGAVLTVDNSAGAVGFGTLLEDIIITAASGTTGTVRLENGLAVSNVTFNADAAIEGATPTSSSTVTFEDAVAINGNLELAAQSGRSATLNINGEQTLGGTGTIDLSRANLNPGQTSFNTVDFNGDLSGTAEVLTFGAGLELRGEGTFFASQTEDSIAVLGQVTGVADQTLILRDVNNAGGALNIDATEGMVLLGERVTNTDVTGTGRIGFESSITLDNVTLSMDADLGSPTSFQQISAVNGLTVESDLTIAAGQNRQAYLYMTGEQTLDGAGTITMSDSNAPIGNFTNYIIFDGVLSGSETLTIDAATTITGQGYLYAQDTGDDILLEGAFIADDGQLQVDDLQALEGMLGATADGVLDINTTQELTERGTLAVGLAGSGADRSAGRIDHNSGVLTLEGTLGLDVAADFEAALGDTFDIITSQGGFAGSFDAFEGFDLADNLAFKLIQPTPNTLTLEVTTDADAIAGGFVDVIFTPGPRPPFVKTDVILTDALPARLTDANVIGNQTTDGGPNIFENVTFRVDYDRQAILSDVVGSFEQGLELDDVTFMLAGSQQAEMRAEFDGTQTVSGTGTFDFIRDSGFGLSAQHQLRFDNMITGPEVLTLEEGITVRGHVQISAQEAGTDRIKLLGTLEGVAGSTLTLRDLDNDGADVTVDASAGTIFAGSSLRETRFVSADGSSGAVKLQTGATLEDVTFAMDAALDASGAGSIDVDVVRGLALEASTLTLQGFNNQALLDFRGAQSVSGTGTIVMLENSTGPTDNDIRFDGFESFSETLSFGSEITLRGTGLIDARDAEDTISILGTLVGEGTGILAINDLDNVGGTVTVDASAGAVGFGSGIANTTIAAATGNTGSVDLLGSGGLRNVSLGIDTRMDAELSSLSATVRDGLTLNDATLTLAGSEFATATLTFFGEQTLAGTGTLLLSDENAIDGRVVDSDLVFTGTEGGQETFRIAGGVALEGTGAVRVSAGDLLDLDGDATARGGTLSLQGIEDVSGEITATAGSILSFDRTFGLDAAAGVTVELSGSGPDLSAGFVNVAGLVQRGGTFTFDMAPDFDAEIGAEFEVLRTTEGFTDTFTSIVGVSIDATRGLALIEDGTSLFARVVDIAQAGQQLTRADLPMVPMVPVLSQNLTDETIDQTFLDGLVGTFASEELDAQITTGVWSGVTLDAVAGIGDQFTRSLDVEGGLTVDGDLRVGNASSGSSRVDFRSTQVVDGTGTITLETANAYLQVENEDSSLAERVTLGADLTLRGTGYTQGNTLDRFTILGDVFGDDGELRLAYIDNAGAALKLDSSSDGYVELSTAIDNAAVQVAAGADVRAVSSQFNTVSLGGTGTTRIESATVSDLTVLGQAEIEGVSANRTATVTVTNDLTVEGELALSGTNSRFANLNFTGGQAVDGAGEIFLSRNNAIGDETIFNQVTLNNALSGEREVLTFGEDIAIKGTGGVTVSRSEDRIQVLGTAAGVGGQLLLSYVDNEGAVLTVDNSAGAVGFGTLLEDIIITAASGTTGTVRLENGLAVSNVTFNADAAIEGATPTSSSTVTFEDAVAINGNLELAAQSGRSATLNINGEQTLGGTGTIDLSRANLNPGQTSFNTVDFNGDLSGTAEVLTFGAGLELRGEGTFFASQTEDSIAVLGQVTGVADQTLILRDVNNAGGALNIDATEGMVLLGERVTNTDVTGTGRIGFESSITLDNVTLSMDADLGSPTSFQQISAVNGLTVESDLTIAAGQNRQAYLYMTGEQTLDGAGTITMSDSNAPIGNFTNYIIFDGVLSGSETLTIDAATTITGQGYLYAQDTGDDILLEGAFIADDGQLQVDDLQALEGMLGATADGVLDINTTQELTERGTLAVGLAGSGADRSAGRIDHNSGVLTLEGTLGLDVAADFEAALGDTFDIITSQGGFAGSFDAFEGFDLADNLAFKLIQPTPNTLTLEVTTDADAIAGGFVDVIFTPGPRPPFVKTDVILTDALPARLTDANVIGNQTTDGGPNIFENVTFRVDYDRQAILSDVVGSFEQGLELDDVTFMLAGSQQAEMRAEFDGTQTVSGTGTFDFIRDSGFGLSAQHQLRFDNMITGPEVLTLEEGITVRGHVQISAQEAGTDRIKLLGTLEGVAGSTLTLRDLDNDGADVTVDASAGTIFAGSSLRETRFVSADGSSGAVKLQTGATLEDVTFAMDAALDASGAGSIDVDVVRGLALEASTLTLQGFNNQALLDFRGAQSVSGTGTIVMLENSTGPTDNDIRFDGFESFSETLSFGSEITLRGTGLIDARDAEDTISILGTLVGEGTGILAINDLDNVGGTVTVDASAGAVGFGSGIANTTIAAATGNTGSVDLLGSGGLRNVSLGIDTRMDAELSSLSATVRDGLTLNDATLTLAGSEFATATLTFFGEQTLAGTGTLLLSDENAIDGRVVDSDLVFTGTEGGQETFRIAGGVALEGTGAVRVSAGDLLDLDGDATARGGTLSLQGIEDVSGEITATAGSILSFDRTFGLDAAAGVTVELSGSGPDLSAGFVNVAGLVQRGGTFTFDMAPDFDAEIGAEFEVLRTTEGFTDTFTSIVGVSIDATRGLALIEDGTSLFARVVDIAQAGQQLTRADLPMVPMVPVLSQNLTDETIDQTFLDGLVGTFASEELDAQITTGVWSGVTLDAVAGIGDQFTRSLDVEGGLTVDGDLRVGNASSGSSRVDFRSTQVVDGTGTITLETANAYLQVENEDSSLAERVTLGADLTLRGTGYTQGNTLDRFTILGDVFGDDGELRLAYIDNAGAALKLDSSSDGYVELSTAIDNAAVQVAAGADVRAVSSQFNTVSLGGTGTTRIESATVSDLTVLGQAEIEGVSANRTATVTVTNDLTVEGELALSGTNSRFANLNFTGGQAVDGAGEIFLSRNNAIGDETIFNQVTLNNALSGEREVLTFGEDIAIKGTGGVTVSRSEDRIQVLGTAAGVGGQLLLSYVDNEGAVLTVDNSAGAVGFGTLLEDIIITAASGTTGTVRLENGLAVSNVTFNADAAIEGATPTSSSTVTFEDAVAINGNLELAAQSGRSATLNINGEQTLGGTGTIDLSRANLNPGQTSFNTVDFNGDLSGTAEVLTFGAGLELRGEGTFFASQTEDSIAVLGQVTGVADQTLILRDVNNAGGALNIDATEGMVLLGERVTNTDVTGTGRIGFESSITLDNVTLSMDADLGSPTSFQQISAVNGLTVESDLTIAAGQNRQAYLYMTGEQTLDGAGTITMSDSNAPIGNFTNYIIFDGVLSGSETLTIDAATTITGQGYLYAQDTGDDILLEGAFIADDGQLQVDDLQALEGMLGATADGVLDINTTQELTERGTLAVGLAGSGADRSAGRIDHNSGVLTLEGTLGLDVAADFEAALGDTFDIITSQGGFAGSFDAFEGFDLADNLAFKLIQPTPNTLTLEVTTDADAIAFNLEDEFLFDFV